MNKERKGKDVFSRQGHLLLSHVSLRTVSIGVINPGVSYYRLLEVGRFFQVALLLSSGIEI